MIFGTGDFARTGARSTCDDDSPHEVVAFTVHERYIDDARAERPAGRPVRDARGTAIRPIRLRDVRRDRLQRREQGARRGLRPSARTRATSSSRTSTRRPSVGTSSEIGDNCFVFEENVIQPNVRIGNNVILWSGNHIGHDSDDRRPLLHRLARGRSRATCTIGDRTASSASTRPSATAITIAPECVIGAGALIMRDTEPAAVYSVRGTEPSPKRSWDLKI